MFSYVAQVVIILSVVVAAWLVYLIIRYRRKPPRPFAPLSYHDKVLLWQYVKFYRNLQPAAQEVFERRLVEFLSTIKITGVNTTVERLDELFIGASAIIPVFQINDWHYIHLHEVLLYPGSFDQQFNQQGEDRTRAGVVGDGPYQNIMILSRPDLRFGYMNEENKMNTGIHEFVHLIDKTDGAMDGVPSSIIDLQMVPLWQQLLQQKMAEILELRSDIDPYGATNRAEFFAVASEYFFKQPELLHSSHPDLYHALSNIYRHSTH